MNLMNYLSFSILFTLLSPGSIGAEDHTTTAAVILPLTGLVSFAGAEYRNGMQLCNNSSKLNLIFEDSETSPTKGLAAFNKIIISDKPDLVVVALSSVASAVVPVADRHKIPLILTLVSASDVARSGGELVFRYFSSGEQEAPIMADYARENQIESAAVLYLEDEYGESYKNAFQKAFIRKGGKIVFSQSFYRQETDFKTLLSLLRIKDPDAAYIIGYDNHIMNIITQARTAGIKSKLLSNWILASPEIRKNASDALEGVIITTPDYYYSEDPEVLKFKEAYQKRFKLGASAYAALGCDISKLLIHANNEAEKSVIESLKSVNNFPGIMGKLSTDKDGEISFPLVPAIINNEKLRVLTGKQ